MHHLVLCLRCQKCLRLLSTLSAKHSRHLLLLLTLRNCPCRLCAGVHRQEAAGELHAQDGVVSTCNQHSQPQLLCSSVPKGHEAGLPVTRQSVQACVRTAQGRGLPVTGDGGPRRDSSQAHGAGWGSVQPRAARGRGWGCPHSIEALLLATTVQSRCCVLETKVPKRTSGCGTGQDLCRILHAQCMRVVRACCATQYGRCCAPQLCFEDKHAAGYSGECALARISEAVRMRSVGAAGCFMHQHGLIGRADSCSMSTSMHAAAHSAGGYIRSTVFAHGVHREGSNSRHTFL
jgi:hypothetical protein